MINWKTFSHELPIFNKQIIVKTNHQRLLVTERYNRTWGDIIYTPKPYHIEDLIKGTYEWEYIENLQSIPND